MRPKVLGNRTIHVCTIPSRLISTSKQPLCPSFLTCLHFVYNLLEDDF